MQWIHILKFEENTLEKMSANIHHIQINAEIFLSELLVYSEVQTKFLPNR